MPCWSCSPSPRLAHPPPRATGHRRATPTNVRIVSVTEDSITIAWNASTDNSGKIHAYVAGGIYHPGNSTTKTFNWLVPNWPMTFRVSAIDPSGNESALSAPVTGRTAPDLTPPTAPGEPAPHGVHALQRLARVGPRDRPLVVRLPPLRRRCRGGGDRRPEPPAAAPGARLDPHLHRPGARPFRQHRACEQRGHVHAPGERRRHPADRAREPDRGRRPGLLRRHRPALERVDGRHRPAVRDRVRGLPERGAVHAHRTRKRVRRPVRAGRHQHVDGRRRRPCRQQLGREQRGDRDGGGGPEPLLSESMRACSTSTKRTPAGS